MDYNDLNEALTKLGNDLSEQEKGEVKTRVSTAYDTVKEMEKALPKVRVGNGDEDLMEVLKEVGAANRRELINCMNLCGWALEGGEDPSQVHISDERLLGMANRRLERHIVIAYLFKLHEKKKCPGELYKVAEPTQIDVLLKETPENPQEEWRQVKSLFNGGGTINSRHELKRSRKKLRELIGYPAIVTEGKGLVVTDGKAQLSADKAAESDVDRQTKDESQEATETEATETEAVGDEEPGKDQTTREGGAVGPDNKERSATARDDTADNAQQEQGADEGTTGAEDAPVPSTFFDDDIEEIEDPVAWAEGLLNDASEEVQPTPTEKADSQKADSQKAASEKSVTEKADNVETEATAEEANVEEANVWGVSEPEATTEEVEGTRSKPESKESQPQKVGTGNGKPSVTDPLGIGDDQVELSPTNNTRLVDTPPPEATDDPVATDDPAATSDRGESDAKAEDNIDETTEQPGNAVAEASAQGGSERMVSIPQAKLDELRRKVSELSALLQTIDHNRVGGDGAVGSTTEKKECVQG